MTPSLWKNRSINELHEVQHSGNILARDGDRRDELIDKEG